MTTRQDISVYAHWKGMPAPKCIGELTINQIRGKRAVNFTFQPDWINTHDQFLLDPDLSWYSGPQFPASKENFGMFLDSMPDTWGRTLMKRRAAIQAREIGKPVPFLHDTDYLLGVHDICRMGALRFKTDPAGDFLDNDPVNPTPPWANIRELQYSAEAIESGNESGDIKKWLKILIAPGSSLGGARPKANIMDTDGHLWIAKFPSGNDQVNKGAWEYLSNALARDAGIEVAESRLEHITGKHDTFFTKRFDRDKSDRIHFASAMTMTGKTEELIRDKTPSYLDIVEFIQFYGVNVEVNLHQLWRRIIFNILISNTDDHLRNHGFILTEAGWTISPAYDLNPSTDKAGLALNIDMNNNTADVELAISVGAYFRLNEKSMNNILSEAKLAVSGWQKLAKQLGIPRGEQLLMAAAFRV